MGLLFHFPLPILKFTIKGPCQAKKDSRNQTHVCIRQMIFISKQCFKLYLLAIFVKIGRVICPRSNKLRMVFRTFFSTINCKNNMVLIILTKLNKVNKMTHSEWCSNSWNFIWGIQRYWWFFRPYKYIVAKYNSILFYPSTGTWRCIFLW